MKKQTPAAKGKKTVTVKASGVKDLEVKKKVAGGAKAVRFSP